MLELFDTWIRTLGLWGYPVLGLAALIEYVAPPFPGDTVTVLGGAYAARGERSPGLVLLALMVGSVIGLSINYAVGRLVGARVDRMPEGRVFFALTHAQIRKVQDVMQQKGVWLLAVNRFLPTFRAVLFIAAGASHLGYRRVLLLGTLSALAWNTALVVLGYTLGDNAERIQAFLLTWRVAALGLVAVAALAVLVRFIVTRRRSATR
jgi:membrane protein DedA with SNARE-associated domain